MPQWLSGTGTNSKVLTALFAGSTRGFASRDLIVARRIGKYHHSTVAADDWDDLVPASRQDQANRQCFSEVHAARRAFGVPIVRGGKA